MVATEVHITATSIADIPVTTAVGIAGGLLAININIAKASIRSTVDAFIEEAEITALNQVRINSLSMNSAEADAIGGTVGLIAAGGMVADIEVGQANINDVQSRVGDNTTINAGSLLINARALDDLYANTIAASGGLVGIAGAASSVANNNAVVSSIGDNASITVGQLSVSTSNTQEYDAKADAVALGLAAGAGAGLNTTVNALSNVNFGDSTIEADDVSIAANSNILKEKVFNADEENLNAGSASLAVSVGALDSNNTISSDAAVNLTDTTITVNGSNANPGVLEITTFNNVLARDSIRIETVSGLVGVSTGESSITANPNSNISLSNANLENRSGEVVLATRTDSSLVGMGELFSASAVSSVSSANVTTDNNVDNTITISDSNLKGTDVRVLSGQSIGAIGSGNKLFGQSATQIFAASLGPNIVVPTVSAEILEQNVINVEGTSTIKALKNVYLTTTAENPITSDGNDARVMTAGSAVSLSLVPYGFPVPDGAENIIHNDINIASTALVEAGLNNKTLVHVLPVEVNGNARFDISDYGRELTPTELSELGLDENLKYEYAPLDIDQIEFSIKQGYIIEDANNPGNFYEYAPDTSDGPDQIVLETQNFASALWSSVTATEAADPDKVVYRSDVTTGFAANLENEFYVVKPVNLDSITLIYANIGNLLLAQLEQLEQWKINHITDGEAVARYEAQILVLEEELRELGLIQNGAVRTDLDALFIEVPNVFAAPGSVILQQDASRGTYINPANNNNETVNLAVARAINQVLVDTNRIVAHAGAQIDIFNQSPFMLVVNDAIIENAVTQQVVDGVFTIFEPGNVYFNIDSLTANSDTEEPEISIVQDSFPSSFYTGLSGFTVPSIDQDIYINGDIINNIGVVRINNIEGSILVSGEIRAEEVFITAARDFTLNTDGWFHTNNDPRQYLDYVSRVQPLAKFATNSPGLLGVELVRDALEAQGYQLPDSFGNYIAYGVVSETANIDTGLDELDAGINNDVFNSTSNEVREIVDNTSRVLAQGQVVITARFLNINGLIQSGVDSIELTIDSSFNPGRTENFTDSQGNQLSGLTFGDDIPIDGAFTYDPSGNSTITVENIITEGGKIILAGQVLSTGNGELRVANGFANVDIKNYTNFDLVLEGIDTTKDRIGKIIIIDSARLQKDEYVLSAAGTGITHTVGIGSLVSQVDVANVTQDVTKVKHLQTVYLYTGSTASLVLPDQNYLDTSLWQPTSDSPDTFVADGINNFTSVRSLEVVDNNLGSTVVYADQTPVTTLGFSEVYNPREGLHYVWVQGIDKSVTTTYTYYKKSFNLVGDNDFADLLASDEEADLTTVRYAPGEQLLYSETLEIIDPSNLANDKVPDYADGQAYTLSFEEQDNSNITAKTGETHVTQDNGTTWLVWDGENNLSVNLPSEDYTDTTRWIAAPDYIAEPGATTDSDVDNPAEDQFSSTYANRTYDYRFIEGDGGWLRTRTDTTIITEVSGKKDVYTNTLKADYPIDITFIQGAITPQIDIFSVGNIIIGGNIQAPVSASNTVISDIRITSTRGSITGNDDVAIYGATPELSAGLGDPENLAGFPVPSVLDANDIIDLNIEGNRGPLNAQAAGDITITAISLDNTTSSLEIGEVDSKLGDVLLTANNGITAESATSLITGNTIQLDASSGSIGTDALSIRIDTDAVDGGIAAIAAGDIYLSEISGDLKLILPTDFQSLASVNAGGVVEISTTSGDILDGIVELFRPTEAVDPLKFSDLSVDLQNDVRNDLLSFTDGRVFSSLTPAEQSGALRLEISQVALAFATLDEIARDLVRDGTNTLSDGSNYSDLTREQQRAIENGAGGRIYLDLSLEQQQAVLNDLLAFEDGRLFSELSGAEQTNVVDGLLPQTIGGSEYPVSPGLMSAIFPHTNFLGQDQLSTADEVLNIIGTQVILTAGGTGGGVGQLSGPRSLDLEQDWSLLSTEEKELLAIATAGDVSGVKYQFYAYSGGGETIADAETIDFTDTSKWSRITTDFYTDLSRDVTQTETIQNGDHVLVQYSETEFGLYQYAGISGSVTLNGQDFSNSQWEEVDADFGTNSGSFTIADGQIVKNEFVIERLALQLFDDVDIASPTDVVEVTVDADDVVGLDSPDTIKVNEIKGKGLVRLESDVSIIDAHTTGTEAAITTFDDLILTAGQDIDGMNTDQSFRTQIVPTGTLTAFAGGLVDILQVEDDATIRGMDMSINDLTVALIDAGGDVSVETEEGDLYIGKILSGADVSVIAENDVLDFFDDDSDPVANIVTTGSTGNGDIYIGAGGDVGQIENFLEISTPGGELSGLVGEDIFIDSFDDLAIGGSPAATGSGLTSENGNITLDVNGGLSVGLITANGDDTGSQDGLVTIKVTEGIVDRRDDSEVNIDAKTLIVQSPDGVGSATNSLDTNLDEVEAYVEDGGLWISNESDLSIGASQAYPVVPIVRDVFTRPNTLADPGSTIAEDIGVSVTDQLFISNVGDLTVTSLSISGMEVLFDVDGQILDDPEVSVLRDILAPEILLLATAGIGLTTNAVETQTSRFEAQGGTGGVVIDNLGMGLLIGDVEIFRNGIDVGDNNSGVSADQTIQVTTEGFMRVIEDVTSNNADVTLQAIDSPLIDDMTLASGADAIIPQTTLAVEDLTAGNNYEASHTASDGSDVNDEDFTLTNSATVQGGTSVTILAGDDVLIDADTNVNAGGSTTIRADHEDMDPGEGAKIDILGNINSPLNTISGGRDDDVVYVNAQSLIGATTILGDNDGLSGGDDIVVVTNLPDHGAGDSLTIDGRGGSDEVTVFTDGTSDYEISVLDTGARGDGADKLFIQGTSDDDTFLIRANFVAHLQENTGASSSDPQYLTTLERINYDSHINGLLRINGLAGDDSFYSDDNSSITTLDGGAGEDFFQIGQVFGTDRDASNAAATMIAAGDEIETQETTLGFLSNGISFPTTILGGDDNDRFVVYSNKALIKLFGEDGNDEFVVRAFVLAGNSLSTTSTTISGGTGDDTVEYNINAPVSIDGGAGTDTVVIIGTEENDNFVITEGGVQGAGVAVDFDAVEKLEVDALEGDDHFFVLGTNPDLVTTLIGGLGSDTFDVGGDVSGEIVAQSVEGTSGFINHAALSDDPNYNGIFVDGIQLNVAGQDTGLVVISESGNTAVRESDNNGLEDADEIDSYEISLSVPATEVSTATLLYVTVSAGLAGFKEDQNGGKAIEFAISNDGGATYGEFSTSHVLTFDSSATTVGSLNEWERSVTVKVRGSFDEASEGQKNIVISHSTYAEEAGNPANTIEEYTGASVANVEVTVFDDDTPGLIVTELDRAIATDPLTDVVDTQTQIFEGDTDGDFYSVSLTMPPEPGETVTVRLDGDFTQMRLSGANGGTSDARLTAIGGATPTHYTVTFDVTNWDTAFKLNIQAVDDGDIEDRQRNLITHSVESNTATGAYGGAVETSELQVDIRDNNTAGVIVKQSNGSTLVSPLMGDSYTIELTQEPSADVRLQIITDGQTLVDAAVAAGDPRFSIIDGIPTITFDATNWDDPFEVPLVVNPDASLPGAVQPSLEFPAQPHLLQEVRGPLIIEGGTIPTKDRSLTDVVMLPTELDGMRPVVTVDTDETLQNDVLNVFNDGSMIDQSGALQRFSDADTAVKAGLDFLYGVADPADLDINEFANISGLGMGGDLSIDFGTVTPELQTFAGGITYHGLETVEVMLGQGDDTFNINTTVEGSVTVIHGGGNTVDGGDVITVNGGGGEDAPLIIFGDTVQDGSRYNFSTVAMTNPAAGPLQFVSNGGVGDTITRSSGSWLDDGFETGQIIDIQRVTTTPGVTPNNIGEYLIASISIDGLTLTLADGEELVTETGTILAAATVSNGNARSFTNHGNDIIDARNADGAVSIYGGRGNDIIFGSASNDQLAGGSGNDQITAGAGDDHIYGDSGFNIDLSDRLSVSTANNAQILTVATEPADTDNAQTSDDLIAGEDTISGDEDNDIILSDHGVIAQVTGTQRLTNTGLVTSVVSDQPDNGADDNVTAGSGNDIVIAGNGMDIVEGNSGDDIVIGDLGEIIFDSMTGDGDITTVDLIQSTDITIGGDDQITAGAGDDTVISGFGGDSVEGNQGNDDIISDNGQIIFTDGIVSRMVSTDTDASTGDDDTVEGLNQPDISAGDSSIEDNDRIITGVGGDVINGNLGDDIIISDNGEIDYNTGTGDSDPTTVDLIQTINIDLGGDDQITAGAGNDTVIAGFGADTITGGIGNDDIISDNGQIVLMDGIVSRMVSTDTDASTGGNDSIEGLDQPDIANGDSSIEDNDRIIAGVGADIVNGNLGDDIIISDNGEIDYNTGTGDSDPTTVDLIQTINIDLGGDDQITAGAGNDTVIAGFGSDSITGGIGNDDIISDNGQISLVNGLVSQIISTDTDASTGGDDTIEGLDQPDIPDGDPTIDDNDRIISGIGADTVNGNLGDDIIISDNGEINYNVPGGDGDPTTVDLIQSTDISLGGSDQITAGEGDDFVIAGFGSDNVTGDLGNDVILSDNGEIVLLAGAVTRVVSTDTDASTGGGDQVNGFRGANVINGDPAADDNDTIITGVGADTVNGNFGDDIIISDNGEIDYNTGSGDGNPATVDLIQTINIDLGAGDNVIAGEGDDTVITGFGSDTVTGDGGNDIIVSDNGVITLQQGFIERLVSTDTTEATGGADIINGFGAPELANGNPSIEDNDIIVAGVDADIVNGNLGDDIIIGDNGEISSLVSGGDSNPATIDLIQSTDISLGANDMISAGEGDDKVIAGFGSDNVTGDLGNDIILGDNGKIEQANGLVSSIMSTDQQNATGGADTINGFRSPDIPRGNPALEDDDIIIGGIGGDQLGGNLGEDIIIGDNGAIDYNDASGDGDPLTIDVIESIDLPIGDDDFIVAGEGNDIVIAGIGDETIFGGVGSDLIIADNGRVELTDAEVVFATTTDTSVSTGGMDTVIGDDNGVTGVAPFTSNDIIFGGVDSDNLDGGRGSDVIFGDNGEITLTDGLGGVEQTPIATMSPNLGDVDIIEGGSGNDTLLGGAAGDFINDTGGNNTVFGDHGQIVGNVVETTDLQGGVDIITTGSGNDIIFGGAAGDSITTTGGNNVIGGDFGIQRPGSIRSTDFNRGGSDTIMSGNGSDDIIGGAFGDLITSTGGNNNVLGDSGTISGDSVTSAAIGVGGADQIQTGAGNDNIVGGTQGDSITSGFGNDDVLGDDGIITGGLVDSFAPAAGGGDTIFAAGGNNNVVGGAQGDDITTGNGRDNIVGDGGVIRNGVLTNDAGSGGNDNINSGGGNDNVSGGDGSDLINSGSGNDNILGDNGVITSSSINSFAPQIGGNDVINAGAGNDNVIAGQGSDVVEGGSGDDNILGDNGELGGGLIRTTDPAVGQSDRLSGGAGDDAIIGGAAGDIISGGAGNDRILGDNGGYDRNIMRLISTDFTIGGNDVISAGSGDDWVLGGIGNESIDGEDGFDVLLGDNGVIEPIGGGLFRAATLGPLIGGNDFLRGGPGNDILIGGFGKDVLDGGLGEDILIGDNGVVIFGLDGTIYQIDAFGTDPLDRFVAFNLYSRDLDLDFSPAANESDLFDTSGLADVYALQDFTMGNQHRFLHHHVPLDQTDETEADAEQPQSEPVDVPAEEPNATGGMAITLDELAASAAAKLSDEPAVNEDHFQVDKDFAPMSELAGAAVLLSLTGWRRKQSTKSKDHSIDIEKYRVYTGETSSSEDSNRKNSPGRMVFDQSSGKLRKTS
ncbi:MAG: hypothetical protein KTR18_04825 [Acidiferrobacterales bacterium]|nr:hypothetical protein [Acidiferrobacterales bacterium]